MDAIWNGIDQATLDRGYDARASVGGYDAEIAADCTRSQTAQAGRNSIDVVWALGGQGEALCQATAAWILRAV